MPRYYFSIHDGVTEQPDTIGTSLANPRAARSEAIRAAGEMLADVDGNLTGEEWRMTVTDENGSVVLTLRFSAIEENEA